MLSSLLTIKGFADFGWPGAMPHIEYVPISPSHERHPAGYPSFKRSSASLARAVVLMLYCGFVAVSPVQGQVAGKTSEEIQELRGAMESLIGAAPRSEAASTAASPNLVIDDMDVDPSVVAPGGEIDVSCRVENAGNTRAGDSVLGYYLSYFVNGSPRAELAEEDNTDDLNPGARSTERANIRIPSNADDGMALIQCYADHKNSVLGELSENDNTRNFTISIAQESGGKPNLAIRNQRVNVSRARPGDEIGLEATVVNIGEGKGEATTLAYSISNGNFTYQLDDDAVRELDENESSDESATATIPENLQPGSWNILFTVDSVRDEDITSDNIAVATIEIEAPVTKPPAPQNLTPGVASVPGTPLNAGIETLSWDPAAGATSYRLYVTRSTTQSFSPSERIHNGATVNSTSFPLSVEAGYYYRWTVAGYNSAGEGDAVSNRHFYVPANVSVPAEPTGLTPGTLTAPGTPLNESAVTLSWDAVAGAASYKVSVTRALDQAFSSPDQFIYDEPTSTNSFQVTAEAGYFYRWNVVAVNSAGESTIPDRRYFYVPSSVVIPAEPTGLTPGTLTTPGTQRSAGTVTLSWNAVTDATSYKVSVTRSMDEAFSSPDPFVFDQPTSTSSYQIAAQAGYYYRWNVVAVNSAGESTIPDRRYFYVPSVVTKPPAPQNLTPGVASVPGTPLNAGIETLSWDPAAGATSYRLYVTRSTTQSFSPSERIHNGATVNSTSFPLSVEAGYYYRWTVAGYNSAGEGNAISDRHFYSEVAELPDDEVTFTLTDLHRSPNEGLRSERRIEGATVELLYEGTVVASSTTTSSGTASFDIAEGTFDAVRMTVSAGADPATGDPVLLTHLVTAPSNGAEFVIPAGLVAEHFDLAHRLSNLTIEASLLFHVIKDDFRLPRSYDPEPANAWVRSWLGGTDDLDARSQELARLLLAEDALLRLVDDAGRMSDQIADISLDVISFAFVGEDVGEALIETLERSVLGEAIKRRIIGEIIDLIYWITDQTGFYDDLPPSLQEAVEVAADAASAAANTEIGQRGTAAVEILGEALVKDLIVAEFNRSLLGFDYVRRTQDDYDRAAGLAGSGITLESYNDALVATVKATTEAERRVSEAVGLIEAARSVADIEGLLSDLTLASRSRNPFVAIGLVLKGFEFLTLREAGLLAADRYADLRDEWAVSATGLPFGPPTSGRTTPLVSSSLSADSGVHSFRPETDDAIAAYDRALESASAAASASDLSLWTARVTEMLDVSSALSSAIRPPLAAFEATRPAATDEDSTAVADALAAAYALDVARVELLDGILAFGTDPSAPDPFVAAVEETRERLKDLGTALDASSTVGTVAAPVLAFLTPSVPDFVRTGASFEIAAEFVNAGGAVASDVRVQLIADSSLSAEGDLAISVGDVEPGASFRVAWEVTASDSASSRVPFSLRALAGPGKEPTAMATVRGFINVVSDLPTSTDGEIPAASSVGYPYPNPASSIVNLPLTLDKAATIRTCVYDVLGRQVGVIHDQALESGSHTISIHMAGQPSGTYILTVEGVGETTIVRRLSVVR